MNANVTRTNNGKRLLAAILAIVMIACAVAVFASPSTDATATEVDTSIDYGVTVEIDQDVWDAMKATSATPNPNATTTYIAGSKVIQLSANQTWVLTGDVVDADVTIDLNGHNLRITGDYSLSITNNAANDNSGYIAALQNGTGSSGTANLMIDGSTVSFIGNGTRAGGVHAVDAEDIGQVYLTNGASLSASKTATSARIGTVWNGSATEVVVFVDGSNMTFSNAHTDGSGVSRTAIFAYNNSTIDATGLRSGSLAVYADLDDSTIRGSLVGLYGAELTGASTITATTLGLYTGNVDSVFTGFTSNTFNIGAGSTVSGQTIVNGLTPSEGRGTDPIMISGQGTISGTITELTGYESNYNLNGVTLNNVTANSGVGITIGADGVVAEGTVNLSAAQTIDTTSNGKIVESGNAVVEVGNNTSAVFDSKTETITTPGQLVTAAKAENQDLKFALNGDAALGSDLVIGNGTTITQTTASVLFLDNSTIYGGNNSSVVDLKVGDTSTSTANLFIVTLNGSFEISQGSIYVNGVLTDDNEIALRYGEVVISGSLSGNLTFVTDGTYGIDSGMTVFLLVVGLRELFAKT